MRIYIAAGFLAPGFAALPCLPGFFQWLFNMETLSLYSDGLAQDLHLTSLLTVSRALFNSGGRNGTSYIRLKILVHIFL